MKKIISLAGVFLTSGIIYAQIGINTNNPQASFHIDAAKDNPLSGAPSAAQQVNDFVVTSAANVGIGTTSPTDKLDVASGNARIRNINSNVGVGGTDRVVVADANGVLKTIDFTAYSLFHARLAADQSISGAATITTLMFAAPIATSPFYSYNASTGVLTFTQAGNYLVTLQASFAGIPADTQLLLGIRPVPDATYLGRGSHYSATATPTLTSTTRIGELMNYTTLLIIPTAGYQVRFTAAPNQAATVLSTEMGPTGNGNVTNVTVQKI
ncbi:hypothetical protein BN1195_00929 [Chryseobacterium oranimense G311]|uniref:hypothetical protein n=1 Tax=Chryseobacterium oranimense TaxID=421058 RepID=UPI000533A688|nr:hypothetical protein [Chryseobacterium oranimense]CEJ68640.1 hypothetical protein BN1195_00929 [Chryseobacterium oranimense G311]